MSTIRARLAESSTWARLAHSMFVAAWLPIDGYPIWARIAVGGVAMAAYLVSACMPDPKP